MPDEFEQLSVLMRVKLPTASYEQCLQLARYLNLVREYSSVLNLTGNKTIERLASELVQESLKLLEIGGIAAGWEVVDLGSGNGSPVIPLALLCSETHFTAIEVRERRAAFLDRVRAGLRLTNLTVRRARVEDVLTERPASFDLATARAFAPPAMLLPLAGALVRPGGEIRGYTGTDATLLRAAAAEMGLTEVVLQQYTAHGVVRHVYVLRRGNAAPHPGQAIY